jgi:hypothetical protein
MDAALSRNEPTSQTERSCAPPFLQLPSSTSLKIEDPGEWRPQARETSPHLLPVAGFRAKRRNRATSSIFWPGTSVYSYCGTSSPVPAATCRARKPEKGRRDSISRTPAPGHSSIYSAPFKGNHRASVLNQFSKKALFDNHSSSADNSICRHHSNRILPTVPRDQDSLAGERNSHNDDTLFSIPYEQISPAGRNSKTAMMTTDHATSLSMIESVLATSSTPEQAMRIAIAMTVHQCRRQSTAAIYSVSRTFGLGSPPDCPRWPQG